jgi:hypothetical protein
MATPASPDAPEADSAPDRNDQRQIREHDHTAPALPRCDMKNDLDARFCKHCGKSLGSRNRTGEGGTVVKRLALACALSIAVLAASLDGPAAASRRRGDARRPSSGGRSETALARASAPAHKPGGEAACSTLGRPGGQRRCSAACAPGGAATERASAAGSGRKTQPRCRIHSAPGRLRSGQAAAAGSIRGADRRPQRGPRWPRPKCGSGSCTRRLRRRSARPAEAREPTARAGCASTA